MTQPAGASFHMVFTQELDPYQEYIANTPKICYYMYSENKQGAECIVV
jgi:hypothetical protein